MVPAACEYFRDGNNQPAASRPHLAVARESPPTPVVMGCRILLAPTGTHFEVQGCLAVHPHRNGVRLVGRRIRGSAPSPSGLAPPAQPSQPAAPVAVSARPLPAAGRASLVCWS